jgi:methylthioribose-1-phosphate isomerase
LRTIDWAEGSIELIDQTRLPHEVVVLRVESLDHLIDAISRLAVRDAEGLAVVRREAANLRASRPTAVNLAWGVDRALARLDDGPDAVLEEALAIRDDDVLACWSMGLRGADLVREQVPDRPVRIMTICNTGSLAAVERGTALGVVQTLHEQGDLEEVFPVETRPLLQGARLTTWELAQMGAPYRLLVDSAGPFLLARGLADAVLIGADRIAANGDTANKIGSFSLALAARHAGVPFIVVAPESTIDMATKSGDDIEIEDRGSDEVVNVLGTPTAAPGTRTVNPAFDVTPHELITAVVTDRRVVRLDRGETLHVVAPGARRTP